MSKHMLLLNADGSTEEALGAGFGAGNSYTAILIAGGWVQQEDGSYTQTATTPGVLDTNDVVVDIDMSNATPSKYTTLLKAWFFVGRAYTIENGITFVCYDGTPRIDINVKAKVF